MFTKTLNNVYKNVKQCLHKRQTTPKANIYGMKSRIHYSLYLLFTRVSCQHKIIGDWNFQHKLQKWMSIYVYVTEIGCLNQSKIFEYLFYKLFTQTRCITVKYFFVGPNSFLKLINLNTVPRRFPMYSFELNIFIISENIVVYYLVTQHA